ncbi:MAG: hypothetical protein WC750_02010 [Patescibacteria group bacterium]|jgi:hypothetical protein
MPGIKPIPSSAVEKGQETQKPFGERLEVLFKEIEEYSKGPAQNGLREKADLQTMVDRVFEHSVEDGLKLAGLLQFKPLDYQYSVLTPQFAVKHPKIYARLSQYIEQNWRRNFRNEFTEAQEHKKDVTWSLDGLEHGDNRLQNANLEFVLKQAKEIIEDIDALYTELLKNREVPTKNLGGPEKITADEFAEDYLEHIELVMNGAYYAAPVEKAMRDQIAKLGKKDVAGLPEHLFDEPIVTEEEIRAQCIAYLIDYDAIKPKLKGAKYYLTQAAKAENIEAEQKLLKKLKADLKVTGQQVRLDADKDKYVIEDIEKEKNEVREYKEELRGTYGDIAGGTIFDGITLVAAEQPGRFIIRDQDGKVYFETNKANGVDQFLVYSHQINDGGHKAVVFYFYSEGTAGPERTEIKIYPELHQTRSKNVVIIGKEDDYSSVTIGALNYDFGFSDPDKCPVIIDSLGNRYGEGYKNLSYPSEYEGKLLFFGQRDDDVWERVIIDVQGKEKKKEEEEGWHENSFGYKELSQVWQGFPLGHAHEIVISDGKVYYLPPSGKVMSESGDVVYDGSEGDAKRIYNIDGKLYFVVLRDGLEKLIDSDHNKLINTSFKIEDVAKVGDHFYAEIHNDIDNKDDIKKWIKPQNSDEVIRFNRGKHAGIDAGQPFEHEGKCFYVGETDQGSEITDLDGKVVYKTKKEIRFPVSFENKIYFVADKGSFSEVENNAGGSLVYAGKISSPLVAVGDSLFASVEINGKFRIMENIAGPGQRSEQYDEIKSLCNDNGQLAFMGLKDGRWHKVVIDVAGEAAEPEPEREKDWDSDKRLTLLNIVHHPTKKSIEEYHNRWLIVGGSEAELKGKKRGLLGKSVKVAKMFTKAIQEIPEAFINTVAAKMDKAPDVMADRLLSRMFPQTWADEHEFASVLSNNPFRMGNEQSDVRDALRPCSSTSLEGGGADALADSRVVLESREPIDGLLVKGIYGACNPDTGQWRTSYFPVTPAMSEPLSEMTFTLPNTKGMKTVALPVLLNSKIIPERIKAVRERNGKTEEEPLEASIDALGQVSIADIKKSADKIVYSIQVGAYEPLIEVSDKQYSRYKEMFERANGPDLGARLPGLPDEIEIELNSQRFKDLEPKDKLMAVEKLVRSLGFYDFDNQETLASKRNRSVADKIALMGLRVDDLLSAKPELESSLRGKELAGVCADFALITCAALRKAGFLAGVMEDFGPRGSKKVMMKDAHAVAFAVWPNETGGNRLVEIDGTPGGADPRLADITQPTLEQKEAASKVQIKEVVQKAEAELREILDIIESKDVEAIRQLENGRLERSLNALLRYKVKRHHVAKIEELLNVFWYGGLSRKMEKNEPADMLEIRKTIEEYLTSAKAAGPESKEKIEADGTRLFNTIAEFIQRFMKSQKTKDPKQALGLMDRVLDMARPSLEKTEEQAMAAVITYLKAKKVG